MSRVVESIVLAVGNEYAVGTYRSASLQIDNVVSTSGAVVRFEGTVDENRWYPVQVRKRGQNEWSREISIFDGDIIELQIENLTKVRVAAISETPVNAEAAWISWSFNPTHLVAAASETDVRAAIEYVANNGGGTVEILPGVITLTSPLPLYDGVTVRGQLGSLDFTSIPDSFWNYEEGFTVLVGDGTFNAFEHNAVDSGTLPVSQEVFSDQMITNFGVEYLAFDGFTCAVQVGAANRGGGFFFHLRDLLIKNTYSWAIRLTNCMHYEVERIKAVNTWRGGAFLFEGNCPDTILQTGNAYVRHIFACPNGDGTGTTAKQRRKAVGCVFRATNTAGGLGILNEMHVFGVQVNMFNRAGLSETVTFTNGSPNITVADGTEYQVGMPVRFTTTPVSGFTTNRSYFVRSVIGNVITLALDHTSTVINAGANGSATMLCNGMPAMACIGNTASSRINNSDFKALDLEGGFGAGLVVDRGGTSIFEINQLGSLANNIDIVVRGTLNSKFTSMNTAVADIDGTSSASYYEGRMDMLDRPGKGFGFNGLTNTHHFSMGGSGVTAIRMTAGDGMRMATNAGFGLQFISRSASLTMGNQNYGMIVLTGTTAGQNITLPSTSNATSETGNAGCLVVIVNRSNQNWTIQTTSSQTFNGVGGKTSFVLPAGQMSILISDGTGYGGLLGAALP